MLQHQLHSSASFYIIFFKETGTKGVSTSQRPSLTLDEHGAYISPPSWISARRDQTRKIKEAADSRSCTDAALTKDTEIIQAEE
ncbi:hypothetical protein V6N11_035722 [Hibiscus sabdariffa]|uniref:Uncharacterized protein n=1 Tax=Hibiscus sabdariffa TaxID=183260 RepID=A0ABR2R879_9ROSI